MIITTFNCSNIIGRCLLNMRKDSVRSLSFRRIKKTFTNFRRCEFPTPPYEHICQLGDPVLRTKATPVDPKTIQTHEFQKLLEHLRNVVKKHNMIGLAAPQVGIPLQVFVIEVTEKSVNDHDSETRELFGIEEVPLTYFINPKMEIMNLSQVTHYEICGSVNGYTGQVARAKEVQIKALNRFGEPFTWLAKGWSARIAQHEFDHLQGIIYIDKMDPSTFQCCHWQMVNLKEGEIELKYYPK